MLLLEAVSVGAILFLALRIFSKVPLSAAPWQPHCSHAWAGIGNGMVFAILAFGGFEGAATLGEETRDPKRAIPLAFMGTVLLSGFLYVIVSYAQILGYGVENVQALGQAESPLSVLSAKFVSRPFAEFIALATAFSAFACTIGSLSAGARMLYTLGRAGTAPWFGVLHPKHRTPARALLLLSAASILGLLTWGFQAGGLAYSGGIVTIGTLALILVYMGVTGAEMVEAFRRNRAFWIVLGFIGTVLLLWPLWNSLYPVPNWPDKLWPYIVVLWLILGALQISRVRKAASITEPVMADQLSGAELGN
jgi:amino acid transporter